jgi:hypothetical protein
MPPHHPLTRQDLDHAPCEECGGTHFTPADPLEMHALCHPRAGFEMAYSGGVLTLRCRQCAAFCEHFAIARDADHAALAH